MKKLNQQQQQLVADNHNLIYSYIDSNNLDVEEHYDILAIALCRAALLYDESKGKFSTFAYAAFRNEMNQYYRKLRQKRTVPQDKIVHLTDENQDICFMSKNDYLKDTETEMMIDGFRKLLTQFQLKVFELMIQDFNQTEIAKKLNVSRSWVHYNCQQIRKKYRQYASKGVA